LKNPRHPVNDGAAHPQLANWESESMSERPKQTGDLKIEQAADGFMVYAEQQNRVHYLNHTAALVLELCNGEVTVDEMIGYIQEAYELPEAPAKEVKECLATLRKEKLVT
jgi:hypothetical protein